MQRWGLVVLLGAPVSAPAQSVFMSLPRLTVDGQTTLSMAASKGLKGSKSQAYSQVNRHAFNLGLSSEGFIWKPWFSSLSLSFRSSLNYLSQNTRTVDNLSSRRSLNSDQWSVSNNYGVRFSLVPSSRMPFNLSFGVSQLLADRSPDLLSYSLNLQQQFTPLFRRSLRFNGMYSLDLDDWSTNQNFNLGVDDRLGAHNYNVNFSWQQQQHQEKEQDNHSYSVEGNHSVALTNRDLAVSNFASWIYSDVSSGSALVLSQLYNTLRWLPRTYSGRLDYRGTTRVLNSEFRVANSKTAAQQWVHDSSVGYRISPEINVSSGLGFSFVKAAEDSFAANESLALSYSPPGRELGVWKRDWSTNGSVGLSQSKKGNTESAQVSVSQRFDRDLDTESELSRRIGLNQGLSSSLYRDGFDPVHSLLHGATFSLSDQGAEANSNWNLSISDSRQISGDKSESQLLRVDFSRDSYEFRAASFRVDIDGELFRKLDREQAERLGVSVDAVATYRQGAVFRISRLAYVAEARLSLLDNIKAAEGDALHSVLTWRQGNALRWNWGLLSLSGVLDFSGTREVTDVALRFEIRRLWRPFG